jgi:tetratricopeptide (TPR) repeat protein
MRLAALAFFAFCAATGVRLAIAGYWFDLDTPAAVERAADAVHSGEYAGRLAEIDPERARSALDRAIRWNPRSSAARIARGLEEERAGDFEGAARDLVSAAEVDHQYLPAWTLANFYFRRGDRQDFRKWVRRSAQLVPGDVEPLLVLCDRMEHENALAALPEGKRFERAYLDFLIRENRLDDAGRVAMPLGDDPEDVRRLAAFTTRLIDAGRDSAAIAMWRGPVNRDLRAAPSGVGFDWRMRPVDGVTADWSPGRLTFWLSGREPETCVVLEQPAPVEAGRYRMQFEYATTIRGLRWTLDSAESAELGVSKDAQNGWVEGERSFSAARPGLAWLRLVYRRDAGMEKAQGKIEIRSVRWGAN